MTIERQLFGLCAESCDLVTRSCFGGSRTKRVGGGGGGRRKQDLAKYECVGQSTAHAPSLTCFSCVQTEFEFDNPHDRRKS